MVGRTSHIQGSVNGMTTPTTQVLKATENAYMRHAFTGQQWELLTQAAIYEFGPDAAPVLNSKAVRHADDNSTFEVDSTGLDDHRRAAGWIESVTRFVVNYGHEYI